jgi:hypothetical protein
MAWRSARRPRPSDYVDPAWIREGMRKTDATLGRPRIDLPLGEVRKHEFFRIHVQEAQALDELLNSTRTLREAWRTLNERIATARLAALAALAAEKDYHPEDDPVYVRVRGPQGGKNRRTRIYFDGERRALLDARHRPISWPTFLRRVREIQRRTHEPELRKYVTKYGREATMDISGIRAAAQRRRRRDAEQLR